MSQQKLQGEIARKLKSTGKSKTIKSKTSAGVSEKPLKNITNMDRNNVQIIEYEQARDLEDEEKTELLEYDDNDILDIKHDRSQQLQVASYNQ